MVRCNSIDAAAFRCCCEYRRLTDILIYIEGDEVEGHHEDVADHHEKISRFETMKSINAYHTKAVEVITQNIKDAVKKVKTGEVMPEINVVELK